MPALSHVTGGFVFSVVDITINFRTEHECQTNSICSSSKGLFLHSISKLRLHCGNIVRLLLYHSTARSMAACRVPKLGQPGAGSGVCAYRYL
jgi:hypothetical protein